MNSVQFYYAAPEEIAIWLDNYRTMTIAAWTRERRMIGRRSPLQGRSFTQRSYMVQRDADGAHSENSPTELNTKHNRNETWNEKAAQGTQQSSKVGQSKKMMCK